MKQVVPVPGLVSPQQQFGYAQCVTLDQLVFVSGQASLDDKGNVVDGDVESQARKAFGNLRLALRAAGSDLDGVLAMTSFIVDIARNGPAFWKVRKEIMPDANFASATIGVAGLVDPRLLLEIQCTAVRAGRSGPAS